MLYKFVKCIGVIKATIVALFGITLNRFEAHIPSAVISVVFTDVVRVVTDCLTVFSSLYAFDLGLGKGLGMSHGVTCLKFGLLCASQ